MSEYSFSDFQEDYETNLDSGTKWFTASWLPSGKMARFISYPNISGLKGHFRDISSRLIVTGLTSWTSGGATPYAVNMPAPQRGFTIKPTDTITRRKTQSGKTESRRFGSGAPDLWEGVVFRVKE